MLNIAAVQVGNYEKRGAEYVRKLFDGVRRHMPKGVDYRCVCFTDDPGTLPIGVIRKPVLPNIGGWWNKLQAFAPDAFDEGDRVLLFDLDTIILGDLSDIASYSGPMAMLTDPFFPEHLGSAAMAWEAGTQDDIWNAWDAGGRPSFDPRGDQFWIESMRPKADRLQTLYPRQFVSFKVDCWRQGGIPDDARVLLFHGHPRPHECRATFVENLWRREPQDIAA